MDNFNLNKYFKNQYLSEGDISSSDIMPHKLQSHPDIKILIDTLIYELSSLSDFS